VLEQIILENSSEKQAKLLEPAKRAHKKPDIGVEIQNKSAYYVIRDCAMITQKYLVHHIWSSYQNPFEALKGKFTKEHIADFLKRAKKDSAVNHLKHIVINDIKDRFDTTTTTTTNFDYSKEEDDIYKYYSDAEETEDETVVEQQMTEEEMLLKYLT
tara:strand:+ start:1072 stop:1542 length:471 start_codon:yes stop_codon:yes gene_type:complete